MRPSARRSRLRRKAGPARGEIVAGEAEERHEGRRQRASVVEEVVDGMADVELIDGEGRQRRQTAWRQRRDRGTGGIVVGGVGGVGSGTSWAREVEHCGIAGIAQARLEAGRQAGGGESVERAGAPAAAVKIV